MCIKQGIEIVDAVNVGYIDIDTTLFLHNFMGKITDDYFKLSCKNVMLREVI